MIVETKKLGKYKQGDHLEGLVIPPHGCRYLGIIPYEEGDAKPMFISSTLHITQGCKEISNIDIDEKTITLSFNLRGHHSGRIYILFPKKPKIINSPVEYNQKETPWGLLADFAIEMTDNYSLSLNYTHE